MRTQNPRQLGPSFQLLMHVRALLTVVAMFSVPQTQLDTVAAVVIILLAFLYWLAGRYWELIVPRLVATPLLTGIDLGISFLVLTFEGPGGPFFQSTVAASAVAGLLYRWRGSVLVVIVQVACYFAALGYYDNIISGPIQVTFGFQTLVGQPAYYPIVGLVGVMLRNLFDQQDAADSARRTAEIRVAAADERARLAREMHDSLAKTLRGIAMSAQALPVWVRKSPERAAETAQQIASAAEIASREARELIVDLRGDPVQLPLVDTVQALVDQWSDQSGITVHLKLDGRADLPLLARYEFVAILKEALINIERHADAESVTVSLSCSNELQLGIEDDGVGFTTQDDGFDWLDDLTRAGHYGVVGMHERAKRAGAMLAVRSAPGQGTTITVTFPLGAVPDPAGTSPDQHQPTEA